MKVDRFMFTYAKVQNSIAPYTLPFLNQQEVASTTIPLMHAFGIVDTTRFWWLRSIHISLAFYVNWKGHRDLIGQPDQLIWMWGISLVVLLICVVLVLPQCTLKRCLYLPVKQPPEAINSTRIVLFSFWMVKGKGKLCECAGVKSPISSWLLSPAITPEIQHNHSYLQRLPHISCLCSLYDTRRLDILFLMDVT